MKSMLMATIALAVLLQADDKAIQSDSAKKALIQFAQERAKIEERYQADLGKAADRLVRRLETAKQEQLKRGDLEDATRIDVAIREATKKQRTAEQLQKELVGTRWTWRSSGGGGALEITFGDGWFQLSDQKVQSPFAPSSGNQVLALQQVNGEPAFDVTFTDDLQMFLYRSSGAIRVGSRIK